MLKNFNLDLIENILYLCFYVLRFTQQQPPYIDPKNYIL